METKRREDKVGRKTRRQDERGVNWEGERKARGEKRRKLRKRRKIEVGVTLQGDERELETKRREDKVGRRTRRQERGVNWDEDGKGKTLEVKKGEGGKLKVWRGEG